MTLDLLLDAIECALIADVDPFDPPPGADDIVLGSCAADGFAMIRDPSRSLATFASTAYRPWNVGQGVACPAADPMLGNCGLETFRPWRPGRRA